MRKEFSISINKPCSQKFDSFKVTEKGGYCDLCSKEVVDFRKFTDKEIINFFNKNTEKTCGLFLINQMKGYENYQSDINFVGKKSFYKTLFGFSFLSLFAFNNGFSQSLKKEAIEYEVRNKANEDSVTDKKNQEITIGFVFDETGPLPGAIIVIKNTNLNSSSGFDGSFIFNKKLNEGDILVVSFLGFKTKEYVVSDPKEIKILLDSYNDGLMLMGEVTSDKVYKTKPTFWQRIKLLFK